MRAIYEFGTLFKIIAATAIFERHKIWREFLEASFSSP
jgi:hypothetical protein